MSVLGINKTSSLSGMGLASSQVTTGKAKVQANATSASNSGGLSSTTTGTTFLNLLVKELQNQDPTAPMDSTAMVGQMISLNQLDQLISINQTISGGTTSTSSHAKEVAKAAASQSIMTASGSLLNNTYSPISVDAASADSNNPTTALNLSNLNTTHGGK